MERKKLDRDWVISQIEAARVKRPVGNATLKLVDFIDSLNISNETKRQAFELASKIALGHAIVEDNKDEVWVPVRPGDIRTAEQVRVRSDAFSGDIGVIHNGRRGVVIGVRYGDVIVKTTDGKDPYLEGAHYSPHQLEKLIAQ